MKAQTARRLRSVHQYVGLFFTPAILFFALSGALQTLGLHENRGLGRQPPTWIRWMASVHKDQRLLRPEPAKATAPSKSHDAGEHGPPDHHDEGPSPIPMKVFVLLLALGLTISSLLGATIALTNRAVRRPAIVALAVGIVVPLALLFL